MIEFQNAMLCHINDDDIFSLNGALIPLPLDALDLYQREHVKPNQPID
jgi:hypothetical protein